MPLFKSDTELAKGNLEPLASPLEFRIAASIAGIAMAAGLFSLMNEADMSQPDHQNNFQPSHISDIDSETQK